jgi:hypothetical protein
MTTQIDVFKTKEIRAPDLKLPLLQSTITKEISMSLTCGVPTPLAGRYGVECSQKGKGKKQKLLGHACGKYADIR